MSQFKTELLRVLALFEWVVSRGGLQKSEIISDFRSLFRLFCVYRGRTSELAQKWETGFGTLSKDVEKVFTLDNFGAIITMGFETKGGFDPSSRFHSVNAIQHN